MQRDEKQFDVTLDTLQDRLKDIRMTIGALIQKLEFENETMNWPTFLDNFALICSHLTSLSNILNKDQCPPLRNRTVLPLIVSLDRDESLITLTEGRVPVFAHDIVPDYLRTRPDPIMEQKMLQNEQKAANITMEAAAKQVSQYNKVVSHVLDVLNKAREEWDIESSSRPGMPQSCSMADTQLLIAAVDMGKGLKMTMPMNVPIPGPSNMMVPPTIRAPTPMGQSASPSNVNQLGKAPSAIKTNIKSAMQAHPFSR